MSSAALSWAFEKVVPNLRDQVEKLVLLRLADRADPSGVCWPGHQRTGSDLNISFRSVQRAVKKLSALGLLSITDRPGTSSLIKLHLDHQINGVKKKEKRRGDMVSPLAKTVGGDTVSPQGWRGVTPGGDMVSPESPIESKKEPPPQRLVVVSELKEKSTVVWPAWIDEARIATCELAIAGSLRQQALVDELAGQSKQVQNPAAWLRRLAALDRAGELILDHAAAAAAARLARTAANERARLTISQHPVQPQQSSRRPLGQAQRDELARLRSLSHQPKSASAR